MSHRVRVCLGSSAVFLLLAAFAMWPAWAAPRALKVHDLGTFNGFDTIGLALNDHGQIVGTALLGPENARAFLWDAGTMIDLGPAYAPAINNRGQILLQQFVLNPDDSNRCFLRDGETLLDLGTPEGSQCFAGDLNNRGQAVGTIQRSVDSPPYHISSAFLWDSGALIELGSLGGDWSFATAVNDRGQVVGGSSIAPFGAEHAFLWEAGRMIDLGAPLGASRAFAINNRGQVVSTDSVAQPRGRPAGRGAPEQPRGGGRDGPTRTGRPCPSGCLEPGRLEGEQRSLDPAGLTPRSPPIWLSNPAAP